MNKITIGGRNIMSETTTKYETKSILSLGIDPGIGNTGYAFVQKNLKGYRHIDSGTIETPKHWDEASRLHHIETEIHELLKFKYPRTFCIESIFFQKNQKTAMSTAKVIGICLSVAKRNHIQCIKEVRLSLIHI